MAASTEFISLCRSQLVLLTQALGASMSVVYLTEQLTEGAEPKLIPVVTYPETEESPLGYSSHLLPADRLRLDTGRPDRSRSALLAPQNSSADGPVPLEQSPIVVPLIHGEMVMGLLVTGRDDRPWNEREQTQIDRIADTLAIACILDQRSQWLTQSHQQRLLLDTRQQDLLDNLLHQFRNPLTALRTFGKLLLKRLLPDDPNRDIGTGIVRESDRLQDLLKQFEQVMTVDDFEVAPLSLGPATSVPPLLLPSAPPLGDALVLQACSLATVLQPLLMSVAAIAQERDLRIEVPDLQTLPWVWADAGALREVLSNLIDNALKYTPADGQIEIQVMTDPQPTFAHEGPSPWVGIAIRDTGPGIPTADQSHLFERHYRGIQADGKIPGSGLGLAIARDLTRQMQGEIQLISSAPSAEPEAHSLTEQPSGSTFIVWLPLAPPPQGDD
ncbi:GAF domain-containing sensor histidine kinase [Leptolyngbya sp. 'hensonii']|uniref:GAF domain-containing sensor histidine kinase n=1 Tax=Leptolyngbya sp. 'hensonii' TaxID=1922337 RepID=UPI001C0DBB8E|nr:GAF domain-containing sensor histidine kinase [Leptolyngbya sp. 'hensonii']